MRILIRSTQADEDLIDIWTYIAAYNEQAADDLLDRIEDKCRSLAVTPGAGQRREELAPELRCFPVGNYVIFYRPITHGIHILRVLSAARDVNALSFDP